MINEDRKVIAAVQKERERIAHGVEIITHALRKGEQVIFIGAGTKWATWRRRSIGSRTFDDLQDRASHRHHGRWAGSGVSRQGRRRGQLRRRRAEHQPAAFDAQNVVIGVSASGMTPFVRGGLTRAQAGGKIIFVTCWPGSELQNFVDLQIAPAVGPEIIAGSTRLKAGTATKMVLNMLTTISMIKLGKTYGNHGRRADRIEKLKDQARRILVTVTGLTYEEADALLKRAKWNVKAAIVMQKTTVTLRRRFDG